MENRVKTYIDEVFEGVYETRQLQDMKEEIRVNLLEKINDFIASGDQENIAFEKAVNSLGSMDELIAGLKNASQVKLQAKQFEAMPLPKSQITGYIMASALFLLGLAAAGILSLQSKNFLLAGKVFAGCFIFSSAIFIYFGLTQETNENYPMSGKRASFYSAAAFIFLLGTAIALFDLLEQKGFSSALISLAAFYLPSILLFIYLGLSETNRNKSGIMDAHWQLNWLNKYANTRNKKVKGLVSGALWVFTVCFFLLSPYLGFGYGWLLFVFAVGFQILIEAYFESKA